MIFGPSESHPLFRKRPGVRAGFYGGVKLFWNGFWTLDFGIRTSDFGPFGASRP